MMMAGFFGVFGFAGSAAAAGKGHLILVLRGENPIPPADLGEIEEVHIFYGHEAQAEAVTSFVKVTTKQGFCRIDVKNFPDLLAFYQLLARSESMGVKCYSMNPRDKPELKELKTESFKIVSLR
jgi:hypothetical protein